MTILRTILALLISGAPTPPLDAQPQTALSPLVFRGGDPENLGSRTAGTKFLRRAEFRNEGVRDLELRVVSSSCGCLTTKVEPEILKPGATCRVTVEVVAIPAGGEQRHYVEIGVRNSGEVIDLERRVVALSYEPVLGFVVRPDRMSLSGVEGESLASHLVVRSENNQTVVTDIQVKAITVQGLACTASRPVAGDDSLGQIGLSAKYPRAGWRSGHLVIGEERGPDLRVPVSIRILPAWLAVPPGIIIDSRDALLTRITVSRREGATAPRSLMRARLAEPMPSATVNLTRTHDGYEVEFAIDDPAAFSGLGSALIELLDEEDRSALSVPIVWCFPVTTVHDSK